MIILFCCDSLASSSDSDSSLVIVRFRIGAFFSYFATFSPTASETLAVAMGAGEVAGRELPLRLPAALDSCIVNLYVPEPQISTCQYLPYGSPLCFLMNGLDPAGYVQQSVHHIKTFLVTSQEAPLRPHHWCCDPHHFSAASSSFSGHSSRTKQKLPAAVVEIRKLSVEMARTFTFKGG